MTISRSRSSHARCALRQIGLLATSFSQSPPNRVRIFQAGYLEALTHQSRRRNSPSSGDELRRSTRRNVCRGWLNTVVRALSDAGDLSEACRVAHDTHPRNTSTVGDNLNINLSSFNMMVLSGAEYIAGVLVRKFFDADYGVRSGLRVRDNAGDLSEAYRIAHDAHPRNTSTVGDNLNYFRTMRLYAIQNALLRNQRFIDRAPSERSTHYRCMPHARLGHSNRVFALKQ